MNKSTKALPSFVALSLKLIGLFTFLFFCTRLLFVLFNQPATGDEPFSSYLHAFYMGIRFDLIITAYVLMLPGLCLCVHQAFFKENTLFPKLIKLFLFVAGIPVLFIACADIPYYSQFGSHINKSVMVWRLSPGYTLKLIFSSFYYWGFSLVFLVLYILYIFFTRRYFAVYAQRLQEERASLLKTGSFFLLLAFVLFAFARGRLSSKSTMHEGMAIVSQNAFVNQVALNANFTLIKSLGKKDKHADDFKNIAADLAVCRDFYKENYFPEGGILTGPISVSNKDSARKLNVVVVLMESLTMAKMGYYGTKNYSPYLSKLAKESAFFDRFFSSGIHTFNGLFSTTAGFPSIYTTQGLREYTRQPFTTLASLLKPLGYTAYFCTTHDPVFDNMEGFFRLNGYDEVISEEDFKVSESIGVTGVPDHLLYKKLITTLNADEKKKPFVAYVMTGTDHGPWRIPEDIPFKPNGASAQENASRYADWAVEQFIEEAKKQSWYKHTVFVFLGDHGQIMNDAYDMPITYHHTPLLVHCPAFVPAEENHHLGYQPDVVKTVASVLRLDYKNFSFGENLFVTERPFIYFSADDKLGFVTDDDLFFYHTLSDNQKKLVKYTTMSTENLYPKQKQRADSLYTCMQSLYRSAQYYLDKNYKSN